MFFDQPAISDDELSMSKPMVIGSCKEKKFSIIPIKVQYSSINQISIQMLNVSKSVNTSLCEYALFLNEYSTSQETAADTYINSQIMIRNKFFFIV